MCMIMTECTGEGNWGGRGLKALYQCNIRFFLFFYRFFHPDQGIKQLQHDRLFLEHFNDIVNSDMGDKILITFVGSCSTRIELRY